MTKSALERENQRLSILADDLQKRLSERLAAGPQWFRDEIIKQEASYAEALKHFNAKLCERDRQIAKLKEGISDLQKLL